MNDTATNPGASATGLVHTGSTTGALSLRALRRYRDRTAFVWDGKSMTYGAAADMIGRLQAVFDQQGLRKGARIALLAGNIAEMWCAGTAAQASAMSITWLHSLASFEDQLFQLDDAEADALVVDAHHYGERGAAIAAQLTDLPVFRYGPGDFGIDLDKATGDIGVSTAYDLAAPSDIAILNYTGGTTGRSKGALRRHTAVTSGVEAILTDFELPTNPRYLAIGPISHVTGSKILPTLLRGGTVHMTTGFDSANVLSIIQDEKINYALMVPTMIYTMFDHAGFDDYDLSSLELLLYGASPMAPSRLVEGIERLGPVFSQLYGQTECYPVSLLRKSEHDPKRPELLESCGVPVTTCEVQILDDSGQEVPLGESGELCVRSAGVMESYWKQPDLTAEAFAHGWLHTGDIARKDEAGRLYIVDRKKDMIISGGFNVYPREVEDSLLAHPGVSMAAVIGVPDEKWGEAVSAMIIRRPGTHATDAELIDHVKRHKGSVQAPKTVHFVDELPTTAVGKIDKKRLRKDFWQDSSRPIG
ncbi:fatty-acyl-CoA synthase [Antricoccus suffuscus]|uniref:Fatty-acyl-CoA synthase n=1 Tax=Antricoccus suffuscus TaxID=1629062 RepID=A0A2T0ZVM1_9ACTN|nr:AMP-binding protein [Antricoccus suffuscus]PRZ40400.1 fatty-acyl-CoA synthase [Antricoccus suffuscus]